MALASLVLATPAVADDCGLIICSYDDKIDARLRDVVFTPVPANPSPKEYLYTYSCYIDDEVRTADGCIDGVIPPPANECANGAWIQPRWSRLRNAGDGSPGPWILEVGYTCPGDPDFPLQLEDFQRLLIDPPPLNLQPETGWVYAGLETIAYTDSSARGWSIELLGLPFDVGAYPIEFTWDFGDGSSPLVTDDPGEPWPDHTVAHTYLTPGVATPSLVTRWQGVYRQGGAGEWSPVPGSGFTTTTAPPITVHTARTRLVEDDLS